MPKNAPPKCFIFPLPSATWNKKPSQLFKLNISPQREAELSFFLLAVHFKVPVHGESSCTLPSSGGQTVQSVQRDTNYKIQTRKSEGRERNKNEDKLGAHQTRQRSATALSQPITRWNWPVLHTVQQLCFLFWIWCQIHCDRTNSGQSESYLQSSFSPHSPALWAPWRQQLHPLPPFLPLGLASRAGASCSLGTSTVRINIWALWLILQSGHILMSTEAGTVLKGFPLLVIGEISKAASQTAGLCTHIVCVPAKKHSWWKLK